MTELVHVVPKSFCHSFFLVGSNPTPVPPTANNQARLRPRPPGSLTNHLQYSSKPMELGHNSQHGSPKSDRSTSASNVTYTTTSSEKSSEKSSQNYVRSQWSMSKSDCSGMPLANILQARRKRCYLPEGCRYVAWVLCALVIAGCASITILYGFRFVCMCMHKCAYVCLCVCE